MIKDQPLVSIIMNCYNGEKYLSEAIESILSQTYENWEIIFWDNNSSDNSAKIFHGYNDPRFKYFYSPTTTLLYSARNSAVALTAGEYITFLDVDDWWEPEKLETQIEIMKDNTVGLVYTNCWHDNEMKNTRKILFSKNLPSGYVLNDLLVNYTVGILTVMVRRDVLNMKDGPFDDSYHIIGDMDLVVRIAMKMKIHYIGRPLAHYRWHGSNESIQKEGLKIIELKRWISDLENNPEIRKLDGYKKKKELINYMEGVYEYMKGNIRTSLSCMVKLPISTYKFKLIMHYILPKHIALKLKS